MPRRAGGRKKKAKHSVVHVAVLKVGPTERVFPGDVKVRRGDFVRWHNLQFATIRVSVPKLGRVIARRGESAELQMNLHPNYYPYSVRAGRRYCQGNSDPGVIIKGK